MDSTHARSARMSAFAGDLAAETKSARIVELARAAVGRAPIAIEPVAPGLGTRRFYRLRFEGGAPKSLIARVEDLPGSPAATPRPPDPPAALPEAPSWLPEPALEPLRSFLEESGLPVPRSLGRDPDQGIELLEDVGDRTLLDAAGHRREDLYRAACGLIPRLQRLAAPVDRIPAFERRLDAALIETKCWKWLNWTIPGLLGRPASPAEISGTRAAFDRISRLVDQAPQRLSHRDFKAENLHLVATDTDTDTTADAGGATGGRNRPAERIVMIDFQGAFMAPPEYDLVCLLYDLQVELEEPLAQALLDSTRRQLPDAPSPETARLRFDALATIRLCKDVSHVVQAGLVRGDRRRWQEIPRGLALLSRAVGRLEHTFPELRTLTSVIHALTAEWQSADSGSRGQSE